MRATVSLVAVLMLTTAAYANCIEVIGQSNCALLLTQNGLSTTFISCSGCNPQYTQTQGGTIITGYKCTNRTFADPDDDNLLTNYWLSQQGDTYETTGWGWVDCGDFGECNEDCSVQVINGVTYVQCVEVGVEKRIRRQLLEWGLSPTATATARTVRLGE